MNKSETKKNISKNYIYNLFYQLLLIVIPLITTPYISRVIGAEGIGVYSYTLSIVSYFTIFAAFGTTVYAQREIAYCQDDKEKRSKIFLEVFFLRFILSVIALIVYFCVILHSQDIHVFLIQSLYIIGIITDVSWYFQGMEEFGKIFLANSAAKILNLICIFLFVNDTNDLKKYILLLALFPVVGNIMLLYTIKNSITKVPLKELNPFVHIGGAFQLFIPAVATQIYTVFDKTMIGLYTDTSIQNGFYEQAMGIIRLCMTIVTSLVTVMVPKISYAFAKGDIEGIKHYMNKSFRFTWAMGLPITVGLAMVAELFVPWYMGDGFDEVIILIRLGCILVLFVGFSNVIGVQYLGPVKKQIITTTTVIIGSCINLCMNLVLIPGYFAIGAVIASVIAEGSITMCQLVYLIYMRKDFKWKDILGGVWKYVISVIIMAILLMAFRQLMSPTILFTFLYVGLGGLIYLSTLYILKDSLLLDMLHRMTNIRKHK